MEHIETNGVLVMKQELQNKINELIARYDPINSWNPGKIRQNSQNTRDFRLPIPGSTIHRKYKGKSHVVRVLKDGFEYRQKRYASLTAVAKEITKMQWNGFEFFGLKK